MQDIETKLLSFFSPNNQNPRSFEKISLSHKINREDHIQETKNYEIKQLFSNNYNSIYANTDKVFSA